MRVFITVLVLIFSFQSFTKADDIRDFEIEGISIGDSLLDYFSEDKIKKEIRTNLFKMIEDKTFVLSEFSNVDFFLTYDGAQIVFKRNDDKYKIFGIHGTIFFKNNISECYDKLKEISLIISSSINYEDRNDFNDLDLGNDRGKYTGTTFYLEKGIISIHCYDWSEEIENERNWIDNLKVNIKSDEYENFLQKN